MTDTNTADAPVKLHTLEIAKPDHIGAGANVGSRINGFMDVLAPTDTIIQTKGGGIGQLQIYKELLRDDQVRSTLQQRRSAIVSKEWVVEPGAQDAQSEDAAEALRQDLRAIRWDDITDKALFAVFYGWGVAEIMWAPGNGRVQIADVKVRDRARFRFGHSGALYLLRDGATLEQMPERKFWTMNAGGDSHDDPYGLGLAHSIYWPVFFKRNGVKFWLVFLERFGQPTARATVPAGMMDDPKTIEAAREVLDSIATDSGVIIPDNLTIDLLEAARSGTADYSSMCEYMDKAIAKVVLSQTASTEGTPGKLGSDDTQKSVRDDVVKADADLICESFNRQVVRWWMDWNFPDAAAPRVYRKVESAPDMNTRADRDTKLHAMGFRPDEAYIKATYGEGWKPRAVSDYAEQRRDMPAAENMGYLDF
ncbi:DUF935 domain-containing protein [Methyloversatilis sp.]|uniref:DUF935 domain-containing protein n=1 Tax=Methyloversatilis sp. TaxID=2569862 RepID=UPI0027342B64|nr:DUF935 family protein [Methyloversatilis sp.]MDP2867747.1 DUF935 family protein [Methyloversatilis sp.]MDP3455488.1 DUF935 family protein [Methyloversatilis sp.]MDP3701308.1 DUF935 family protein [Hylemonella sp.]